MTEIPDYYKMGETLEELVAQLDMPADVAMASIERYNEMCDKGEDTDFFKESHYLYPIKEGPFYACKVGPGLLAITGGVHISDNFEVLKADNTPIPGLYAIGTAPATSTPTTIRSTSRATPMAAAWSRASAWASSSPVSIRRSRR